MASPAMVRMLVLPLIVVLPILAGVAGVVLFIVGLARKRTALWGSGLALALVSLAVFVVGMVAAGLLWYRRAAQVTARRAPAARRAVPVAVPQRTPGPWRRRAATRPEAAFRECTGLDAPAGTTFIESREVSYSDGRRIGYITLRGTARLAGFLREHFAEATWDEVRGPLAGDEASSVGLWTPGAVRGKAYYTRTHRAAGRPGTSETFVALDPNAGAAFVVGVRNSGR